MSALENEKRDLVLAERHLREGAERVTHQSVLAQRLRGRPEGDRAQQLLTTLQETLVQWRKHRDEIIRRIETLEAEAEAAARHRDQRASNRRPS